jgi:cell division protein FtsI/penicillin-binding protein 2
MEKQKKRKQKHESDIVENKKDAMLRNRETNIISFAFAGLFMLMMVYLVYFNVAVAPNVINNPYNKRIDNQETKVVRGDILASDESVLATTETDEDGVETRSYPFGSLFCHVVGLSSAKTGIEGMENYDLLSESDNIISQLVTDATGEKALGNTVVTTLDVNLQQAAYDAIGDNKGAVVVMEPSTGKILAMVSKPDYDPNLAATDYNEWLTYDSSDSVLLNRATQGLYPPGSTFKILTALQYMREYDADSYEYECTGSAYVQGGTTIPCSNEKQHGSETLKTAFANSCNSAFSTIGLKLDKSQFKRLCSTFLFNSSLPLGIEYSVSSFTLDENSGISEVQETSIGQGKTMISPIHNLLIAATVANSGVLMTPYLVDSVRTAAGTVVKQTQPTEYATLMSEDEADTLTEYMRAVVTSGTGTALKYASYDAAGKTGSAQYDSSDDVHSWFVGFAPYDNPEIAVCVILEGGYTGVSSAQYVAKQVFDAYFN